MKKVDAGVLSVADEESGTADGTMRRSSAPARNRKRRLDDVQVPAGADL